MERFTKRFARVGSRLNLLSKVPIRIVLVISLFMAVLYLVAAALAAPRSLVLNGWLRRKVR